MLPTRRARSDVAARLGSKQPPRAALVEAARAGEYRPWQDSNDITLFVQQYDRGTCCKIQRQYEPLINRWYL